MGVGNTILEDWTTGHVNRLHPHKSTSLGLLKQLAHHLGGAQKIQLFALVPCALVVATMDLGMIVALARLVNVLRLGGGKPVETLVIEVIVLGWSVSVLKGGLRLWQYRLGGNIWRYLSEKIFCRLLDQPFLFHLNHSRVEMTNQLLQRLEQALVQAMLPTMLLIGSASTVLVLAGGLLLLAGPLAMGLMLMIAGFYGGMALMLRKPLRRLQEKRMQDQVELLGMVLDVFGSIRNLILEGAKPAAIKRFECLVRDIERSSTLTQMLPQFPRIIVEPAGLTGILLLLLLPEIRSSGASSLPWLALVTVAMLRLAQPLQELSQAFNQLQGSTPLLRKCIELLELPKDARKKEFAESVGERKVTKEKLRLTLEEVYFCYPEKTEWIIKGANLHLTEGEMLAVVGTSGSGKTTLSSLIVGLLSPQEGALRLNGKIISDISLRQWQLQCAEVNQNVRLIRGTIAQNLWGWENAGPETMLWEVLRDVGMECFVKSFPRGLNTDLGEDGLKISGGEKQRLALARALLKRPKLLVLDEATSGLDHQSESKLLKQLYAKADRMIIVIITHRETTMRCCKRIAVLDKGKIIQDGSFDDLYTHCDLFREMIGRGQK